MPRKSKRSKGQGRYLQYTAIVIVLLVLYAALRPSPQTSHKTSTLTTTTTTSHPGGGGGGPAPSGVVLKFGLVDQSVSYGITSYANTAVQNANLAMLYSTGAQCVRTDINYAPWLTGSVNVTRQGLVSAVVSSIKGQGDCVIIADAGSESYRNGGCLNWAAFKTAWASRVSALATLYTPNYYIVIKEPGWYVPMVCDAHTNPLFQSVTDWTNLTTWLTNSVLAASPSTKVGVSIAASSLAQSNGPFYSQYLNAVQTLQGISFFGLDIYSANDQDNASAYLNANPPSKPVWIAEAWSQPTQTNAGQAQSDATWMKSIDLYAGTIGASMLIPFYTDLFSGYTVPTNSAALTAFFSGREPVYTEFVNCVAGSP